MPLGFLISSEQEMNKIFINMGDGKQSLLESHILPENLILVDCGQSSVLESFPVGMGSGGGFMNKLLVSSCTQVFKMTEVQGLTT